jgi:hypothetical protein
MGGVENRRCHRRLYDRCEENRQGTRAQKTLWTGGNGGPAVKLNDDIPGSVPTVFLLLTPCLGVRSIERGGASSAANGCLAPRAAC